MAVFNTYHAYFVIDLQWVENFYIPNSQGHIGICGSGSCCNLFSFVTPKLIEESLHEPEFSCDWKIAVSFHCMHCVNCIWKFSLLILSCTMCLIGAQLAVECIFCSACIRFVECCPQEGLTGLLTIRLFCIPFEFVRLVTLQLVSICREALVWAGEFCFWLAN